MKVLLTITLLFSFALTACNVKKRDAETPVPTLKRVNTDFFFNFNEDRTSYTSKRFLFGSSIEDKAGPYRDLYMDHWNLEGHANIEFEYNQEGNKLIGKLVNPTYPNDKSKWQIIVTFDISSAYYEEKRVDATGRTSNDEIRRSDRSDPRARPFIDLEISSMKVWATDRLQNPVTAFMGQTVYDVEWAKEGNFLGFTVIGGSALLGQTAQTTKRFNLMQFEPGSPDFEETPYHRDNDKYTQIIDIIGSRPNHFGERLKAVHWDINAKTKKKHVIHLHNFPDKYLHVAQDSVKAWNDVFQKEVGYRPFIAEVSKRKYAFDLRYHTIHWVDDIRLSSAGPLGLANMAADITNGKVLWTASIIWGGMLDQYAAMDIPSSAGSISGLTSSRYNLEGLVPESMTSWRAPLVANTSFNQFDNQNFVNFLSQFITDTSSNWMKTQISEKTEELEELVKTGDINKSTMELLVANYKEQLKELQSLNSPSELRAVMAKLLGKGSVNQVDVGSAWLDLKDNPYKFAQILKEIKMEDVTKDDGDLLDMGAFDAKSEAYQALPETLRKHIIEHSAETINLSFDGDNPAVDILSDLSSSFQELNTDERPIDIVDVKKSMMRKTIVHEIGHTLGLAHNFKANILPEKGTVPNAIYNDLKEKAENGMINSSSIMGYPDGRTTVLTPYENQVPGHHDIARIKYLYKKQYPMYDKSTNGESDYVWKTVDDSNGRIEPQVTIDGKTLTPGYLPGCNDFAASFYSDPYCNRHDRGYNARTLMKSYFTGYWNRIMKNLESNIDALKRRDYFGIERYLWRMTSMTLSRGRLFHDYMRNKYRDEIAALNTATTKGTYQNLISFSNSCRSLVNSETGADKTSDELEAMKDGKIVSNFIEEKSDGSYGINEFGDLCIASTIYFDEINKLVNLEGKEYTQIDYFNRLIPGGIRSGESRSDYAQAFGSWKRMSLLPIRFMVMQSMILPYATMSTRYGDYPLYPYNREDTSFSTATLFPEEYLKVVRSLIQSTMHFEDANKQPRISRSLLYLGYFLRMQAYSEDSQFFSSDILKAISDQTQFRFSQALIEVEANKINNDDYAKTFKGSIYNAHNSFGKETLGPIYLFSLDKLIMDSQPNSLILQLSPVRWRSNSSGVSLAIKLDYEPNIHFEELDAFSPRKYFINQYKNALTTCIEGNNAANDNGLQSFFTNTTDDEIFRGIEIPNDIHRRDRAYIELNDSIEKALRLFAEKNNFDLRECENAIETQKVMVLGAALMAGLVFPETIDYLEMGVR